ncbi:putative universal stress protein SAUSA300_1656 [Ostrea edulis]|uniref:putative universal stress protein SAUSA300_1656 n=1 Tax=Ostrea edulis TaxID=37623 RepID=UPI0020962381|nr:putative universal stress protein SAUSA300_1656 [Ostrea edulis]
MLKFAYGHKSHASDVRMSSTGDLTETYTPRTVLIALDGSEDSKFAFYWYVHNIYRPGDRVVLVYAVEFQSDKDYRWLYSFTKNDEEKLGESLDKDRSKHQEIMNNFSQMLVNSKILGEVNAIDAKAPGEGIVSAAKEINASFIVTGTRGLGKVRRTLLGSVSDYVLRHASVPVVVCKYNEKTTVAEKDA